MSRIHIHHTPHLLERRQLLELPEYLTELLFPCAKGVVAVQLDPEILQVVVLDAGDQRRGGTHHIALENLP